MRHALVCSALALLCTPVAAQVTTVRIAAGLGRPLWAGAPAGDARVFIAEKGGRIKILKAGQVLATPFLDLTTRVSNGAEQGLLGVAFHPDYRHNGSFFVNFTDPAGDTVVARFKVSDDPDVADPASEVLVLGVPQPFDNHNGGDLHFGPDGYLYVFLGDGGLGNDPGCRAQKLNVLHGKVLRLDVDSAAPYAIPPDNPFANQTGVRREIFHLGLRNPWRNGFDRLTGDLYIGDVGQDLTEEIDVAPAGSAGLNFGWKMMEGNGCTNNSNNCLAGTPACADPVLVDPITELFHVDRSFAITGGYVYRGWACPSEQGRYFFSDYSDAKIRSLVRDPLTGTISDLRDRTAELAPGGGLEIRNIASFGEDGFGELLILDNSGGGNGEVYKMVPAGAPAALSLVRNGSGANRLCLAAASLPILGGVWEVRVDASAHRGALLAHLVGYAAPAGGVFLGRGEVLVDTASALLFHAVAPAASPSVFRFAVPSSAALAGVGAHVQAAVTGGGLELCNALDVTLGYW
jgi:glucose/arabinose dehydrogenase